MFRKSNSSYLFRNKKNVEKLVIHKSPESSASDISVKQKVTNKMQSKSQICKTQNQGSCHRRMRARIEASPIKGSKSPCRCRAGLIDVNPFKYCNSKATNKKVTTVHQNEHKSKSVEKNCNKNKKPITTDVIKLKEQHTRCQQVNRDFYEETVNYGLRLDKSLPVRQTKKLSKLQQTMIDNNVSELMNSVKSKIDNISSSCFDKLNYEESKCFMDRVNHIKDKLKAMTDLEQIKVKEKKGLKSYMATRNNSKTSTQLKEIEVASREDKLKKYTDVLTQRIIELQSNAVDNSAFENIEKKLERVQSCVQQLQINLKTPFFNDDEVISSHSFTNRNMLEANKPNAFRTQVQPEHLNLVKLHNFQFEEDNFIKINSGQHGNVNVKPKVPVPSLNEMGDNRIRHPPTGLLMLQKETIKTIQNLLQEREKNDELLKNDNDFKSISGQDDTQDNTSTEVAPTSEMKNQNCEDDTINIKFEGECYRLLKEIQKIQKGSVNLLNQLNKGLKEQGKLFASSSIDNVPISLCGSTKKPDIDYAILQNVFGAPGQAHYGQVSPVVPDQGTLSDPDYWDTQDVFRPSSLNYDMFDWTLTKRVAAFSSDNFLLSPLGLKLALAILTEAASGPTQAELVSVLGFEKDRYAIRNKFASIIGSLQTKSTQYILNLGSRVYVDGKINPRQRFAAIGKEFYKTEIKSIDFRSPTSTSQINGWVYNITEGKIPALVTQGDLAQMVVMVLNTLYFQGTWRHQFAPNATTLGTFYVTPTVQKKTLFMHSQNTFYCAESIKLDAKILRLPYMGDKFSMYIIVPNSLTGLPRVIENLSEMRQEILLLTERIVDVSLPKFEFDYTSHLDGVMKEMGVRQAFEDIASFPGISRGQSLSERLKVSKILQKAGIELNELGSTVYSATEISLVNKFGVDNDAVVEVNANKPFLFFIEDESTRQLLFTGRYSDPSLAKTELKHP